MKRTAEPVPLKFHKMHGAGNDFMLLDLREGAQEGPTALPDAERVRAWADRHTGVGFDQLLALTDAARAGIDARVHIWNADGGSAEQCGNGMRAIGLYLARRGENADGRFTVAAPAADIALHCGGDDQVSVAMGAPAWAAAEVPLRGVAPDGGDTCELPVEGAMVRFGALSMGNPHAVIEVSDLGEAPLETLGRKLRDHEAFPESCNVGFVQIVDTNHVRLRVLERGAGETRACGSGACAAVAWLARRGRVGNEVRVEQAGGSLVVQTDRGVGPMTLTGPAAHVFEGTIE